MFSYTFSERTDFQSVASFPHFRLWARMNTTGTSLFAKMFKTHLQVMRRTRECEKILEAAVRALHMINTVTPAGLTDNGHRPSVNTPSVNTLLHLRHYHGFLPDFSGHDREKPGQYRKQEVDSQTPHQTLKYHVASIQNDFVRNRETLIYTETGGLEKLQLRKYNESDRLYVPYRHHTTGGLHELDSSQIFNQKRNGNNRNHQSGAQHDSDRHHMSSRHHRLDRHRKLSIQHSLDGHNKSNIHKNLDRNNKSDIHHYSDRQHRIDRHPRLEKYPMLKRHKRRHRHSSKTSDESQTHIQTDPHKGSHRHHLIGRNDDIDIHQQTANLSLLQLTANTSNNLSTSHREARAVWERDAHAAERHVVEHHGFHGRSKRDLLTGWMIFPGTKWCGDGDISEHKRDMGYHSELDTCCRRHDLCPLVIPRLSWKYGIFNYRLHTLSHCRCDRKLRKCLQASSSPLAHLIGQIYFNVIGPECFKFTQRATCGQRLWWGGCQEWVTSEVAYSKRQRRFK
ncbi:unnamed protein product [Candidula unifasciata]|uniref:phospholipase A2 n=1 Tax=Candidula unifasciata TaxID=100452 RepID=A0A8S3Z6P3_9EUPU|nr:unnamed protein product [Candidula unifasciata]